MGDFEKFTLIKIIVTVYLVGTLSIYLYSIVFVY